MAQIFSLGLIGYPLGHSLSPHLHRAALQALDLQGEYQLFPIEPVPQGLNDLEALMENLRRGEIHGLNVTIPHKQAVINYLDKLTPTAKAIGAVNTIFLQDDLLTGDNTDAPAFLSEIGHMSFKSGPKNALVLGAGGSARAVVFALLNDDWQVNILARKPQQAQELADHFGDGTQSFAWELQTLERLAGSSSLIVNTTPLGMSPDLRSSPWPADLSFPKDLAVYDLVYNPPLTDFVDSARRQGLAAYTGGGMLLEQAALAFERWTGQLAPRDIMRQVLDKQLLSMINSDPPGYPS